MLISLRPDATAAETHETMEWLRSQGIEAVLVPSSRRSRIVILAPKPDQGQLGLLPGVEKVTPLFSKYKLASRESSPENTIVRVRDVEIGGARPIVIAGPCAVEDLDQTRNAALMAKSAGADILRGGAFKPRTSPYSFQGLGQEGLEILARVREETGLPVATEVVSTADLPVVCKYADILQIGARNMQNFALLTAAGESGLPVLLKRGLSATIDEWFMAAEYILRTGNRQVILCERGIRTFETMTRNTMDLSAVAAAKVYTHLPVIADPSHGTGVPELILPMSRAAVMAGADGIIVEVHPDPCEASCDGFQALTLPELMRLVKEIHAAAEFLQQIQEQEGAGR